MKKILCPTDFSDTSYNAIAYAAKLAQVTNSDLTLLNVQSLFDIVPVGFLTGNQFTVKATAERLQEQCEEVSRVFHITCKCEVEATYHKLSTVISEKSRHYDLVVMGSNGADDLYQFFLGSNTYNALTKATSPVLIIPEGHLYTEVKKIVFAFDYLRERKLPMEPVLRFARHLQADITVLQVMEEAVSDEANEDLKELQFILETQAEGYPLKFETIRSSEIARSIDKYILDHEPDVLALCSQSRNFIENIFHKSVIKKISALTSYPVFVFPG
jgi:nucleotide-binding universal stress UspA family protein